MPKKYLHDNLNKFIDSLKEIYPLDFHTVEKGLKANRPTTLRVNTLKSTDEQAEESLKNEGFSLKKGPLEHSYIVMGEEKRLSDSQAFINGEIYVQELASMLPPLVLQPKAGEKILDLASAPGSKTTQMAALTNNESEILAVEKHPIRILTLEHNIKIQGATNAHPLRANGMTFYLGQPQFLEYFDKVLVDAPCSSEGRFNLNDSKSYKYWNIHKRKEMSKTQKGLLISGLRLLKPGGTLVYSTCTFGTEENEQVLQWLKIKMPEIKIEKFDLPIRNTKPGIAKWHDKSFSPDIRNAVRIIPNDFFGGFFIARLSKPEL